MAPMSGVSQKSGQPWMSQEFVLSYYWFPNQQVASNMTFRVFGEDRIKQFNLQQGDEVKIRFIIEAHQSQDGRWFNEVRCQGVEKKNAPQPADVSPQPAATQQTAPTQAVDTSKNDNLPF